MILFPITFIQSTRTSDRYWITPDLGLGTKWLIGKNHRSLDYSTSRVYGIEPTIWLASWIMQASLEI